MRRAPTNRSLNRRTRPVPNASRHVLDVNVRRSTARRQQSRKVFGWVVALILWTSLIVAGWIGFQTITDKFFFSNPEYTLRHVVVETEGLLSANEVQSLTGIHPGTNIFAIDLAKAEAELRKLDQVASVRITREWPDRITVDVTKRNPVAWLSDQPSETFSGEQSWLIDRTGRTMRPYRIEPDFWHLPVIYCASVEAVGADDILAKSDLKAALDLLAEHRKRPESLLQIRSLDITRGHTIKVIAADKSVILFAPTNPADQLAKLEPLLLHCRDVGRTLEFANLIPSRYTPVRFQMVAAPTPAPSPITKKR